jgi:hypothetical protein
MEIKNDRGQRLLAYSTGEIVCLHPMRTAVLCGSLETNGTIPFAIYLVRFKNRSHQRSFFCLLNEGKDTISTIWLLDVKYPCFSCTEGSWCFIKIFATLKPIRFSTLEHDFTHS